MLTEDEIRRYDRQIRIFGEEGQNKLKRAKVFIGGIGGLGSPLLIYLFPAYIIIPVQYLSIKILQGNDIFINYPQFSNPSHRKIN